MRAERRLISSRCKSRASRTFLVSSWMNASRGPRLLRKLLRPTGLSAQIPSPRSFHSHWSLCPDHDRLMSTWGSAARFFRPKACSRGFRKRSRTGCTLVGVINQSCVKEDLGESELTTLRSNSPRSVVGSECFAFRRTVPGRRSARLLGRVRLSWRRGCGRCRRGRRTRGGRAGREDRRQRILGRRRGVIAGRTRRG